MTRLLRLALLAAVALLSPFAAQAAEPRGGDIEVRDAWARATPPGSQVAAVYMTIVGGPRADRLLAASTERAAMTEIHSVTEENGVARMRPVAGGVAVPAGKTITLAPQGLHLMLMMLDRPLVAGEKFAVTLTFEAAGSRDVPVDVRAPGAAPPAPH
jgi:hypothetical protein